VSPEERSPQTTWIDAVSISSISVSTWSLPKKWWMDISGEGAYLLTPGWLIHWRKRIDTWGFDRKTARQFFKESCSRLVLLDTGVISGSRAQLKEFADFIDLPFETSFVGSSFMRLYLENMILRWKLEKEKDRTLEANRQAADYAMAYELIAKLAEIQSEGEAVEDILSLFSMLFAPERLSYEPFIGSGVEKAPSIGEIAIPGEADPQRDNTHGDCLLLESEKGFHLTVKHKAEILGMIKIAGVAFPQYLKHYFGIAATVGKLCGLAISNARTYRAAKQGEEDLRHEIEEREKAESARGKMEIELLRLKKMEAVSVLAGGIAHDFNNLLGVILGHIELAQMALDSSSRSPVSKDLEAAYAGGRRASELVRKFLVLSEVDTPVRQEVNTKAGLTELIRSALESLNVPIDLSIPEDVWPVDIDTRQISKAIRNVVNNAAEATTSGKAVRVFAENICVLAQDEKVRSFIIMPGNYLKISIIDQGIGIPEEHLPKVFDPYFSTKARGAQKGMGMGLTMAYAAIKKHDGHIQVQSKPGERTTVEIYLPALTVSVAHDFA